MKRNLVYVGFSVVLTWLSMYFGYQSAECFGKSIGWRTSLSGRIGMAFAMLPLIAGIVIVLIGIFVPHSKPSAE